MLHPSYAELIKVVNSETEGTDTPVVNSRYSIVLATAKRARQIIGGSQPLTTAKVNKPLSIAVEELRKGLIKISPELEEDEDEILTGSQESAAKVEENAAAQALEAPQEESEEQNEAE
ncbi:MAG: DNA-directed RNA polymerase subunit omega [Eubacteriales bacterium]|nr:DNA-directed RNA polymerase subunit omega [Eubacteriales bacterium]